MKVISIWQPWASLIVHGMKFFETRTWPAPASMVGQTLGIAATKNIIPDQRSAYADPNFQYFYEQSGLPPLEELPRGVLLGTAIFDCNELITEDFIEEITREEQAFGWYDVGGYAWRLRMPRLLAHPIPIRGKQGIFEWSGLDARQDTPEDQEAGLQRGAGEERPADIRRDLHAV